MRRPAILLIIVCLGIVTALTAAYGQEDMKVVDNSEFENPQRPPAVFPHDSHNEKAGLDDCSVCHHVFDENGKLIEGESSEDQMCSDCHGERRDGAVPGLMNAYHLRCRGCHLEKEQGPVLCGQCHVIR